MSLQTRGYNVEALHGDMRQTERDAVMAKFRYGEINMLVATDVAARGLDVERIDVVFNYDVPNDEEYYVHRIGRTARAGKAGVAYTFISGKEFNTLKDIQKFTKASIKMVEPPTLLDIEENRVGKLLKKAAESARAEDISQYSSYVEKIIDEYGSEFNLTSLDVAAALLKMLFEKTVSKPPVVRNNKTSEKPKRYYQKGRR
jgi:ATP-dependent RNA helicase DeaD